MKTAFLDWYFCVINGTIISIGGRSSLNVYMALSYIVKVVLFK